MQTYTKVFDFSFLRNKQSSRNYSNTSEQIGIRNSHPMLQRQREFVNVIDVFHSNLPVSIKNSDIYPNAQTQKDNSYFQIMYKRLDEAKYLSLFVKNEIPVEIKGDKVTITYTTHSEPKEFLMGCYVGKETGNIYFSNTGEDIVVGNLSYFINLDFKQLIYCFQQFKLTMDINIFNKILDNSSDRNTGKSSYLDIFSQTENIMATTITSDTTKSVMVALQVGIQGLASYSGLISTVIKQGAFLLNYSVGRISKLSQDMYDLIDDFSLMHNPNNDTYSISSRIGRLEEIFGNPKCDPTYINSFAFDCTEYCYGNEGRRYGFLNNPELLNQLLIHSVIDNSNQELSFYSEETRKQLKSFSNKNIKFNEQQFDIMMGDFPLNYMNQKELDNFSSVRVEKKPQYKYLQRLHQIIERL